MLAFAQSNELDPFDVWEERRFQVLLPLAQTDVVCLHLPLPERSAQNATHLQVYVHPRRAEHSTELRSGVALCLLLLPLVNQTVEDPG